MKIPKDVLISGLAITPPKTYKDLLKDPKWQNRRLAILQRDIFTCQICGDKPTTLNVHHIVYFPNILPCEYPDYLLLTLCQPCHKKEWAEWMGISYLLLSGTRLSFHLSDLGKDLAIALMWWLPDENRQLRDDAAIFFMLTRYIASHPEARSDLMGYVLQHDTSGMYEDLNRLTTNIHGIEHK